MTGFSQFFRSVGGTAGVAVFGTLMLSLYEWGLQKASLPPVSSAALNLLHNPLEPDKLKYSLAQLVPSATQLADIFHVCQLRGRRHQLRQTVLELVRLEWIVRNQGSRGHRRQGCFLQPPFIQGKH